MKSYIVFICILFSCSFESIKAIEIDGIINGVKYICPSSNETTLKASTTNQDLHGTYKYEWFSEDGSKLAEGQEKTINTDFIGKKIILKSYRNGDIYQTDTIRIKKLYDLGINDIEGGYTPLCKDSTLSLVAKIRPDSLSSFVTYTWIKDGKDTAVNSSEFTVKEGGLYNVRIQYGGCTATASNAKDISAPPTIQLSGLDKICGGGHLNLTASGMDNFYWGGSNLNNTQGNQATISAAGNYYVVGTKGSCRDSFPFAIEEKEKLEIVIDGITALCPGETQTTLTASTVGLESNLEYQWYKGTQVITKYMINGETSKQITVSEEGQYLVKITNTTNNCTGSKNKKINIINNIPNVELEGDSVICAGNSMELTAKNLTRYQWFSNGNTLGNSKEISLNKEGYYGIVGYTEDGCPSDTFNFHFKVNPNPGLILSKAMPCTGDIVDITAQYNPNLTFGWLNPFDSNTTNTIQVSESGTYSASVYDSITGCETVESTDIEFLPDPTITISGSGKVCKGGSSVLTATTAGTGVPRSYKWMDTNGNTIKQQDSTLIVTKAGTYIFYAENTHGCDTTMKIEIVELESPVLSVTRDKLFLCSEKDTIDFTASGSGTYKWIFQNQTEATSSTYKTNKTGDYTLRITNETTGCYSDTLLNVESKSNAILTEFQDTICEGDSGYISVKANMDCNFLWEKDNSTNDSLLVSQSGIYKVIATDKDYGCTTVKEINVTVHENPIAKILPDVRDTSICSGKKIRLSISNKTANNTYNWEDNSSDIYRNISNAGEYILNTTSKFHCSVSDTILISINPLPVVTIEAQDSICRGDSITLHANGADTYAWNQIYTETDSVIRKVLSLTTTFKVTGKNTATGCVSEPVSKTIQVDQPFSLTKTGALSMCDGDSTSIHVSGATSYIWKKDGSNISLSDSVVLKEEGKYHIEAHKTMSTCVVNDSFDVNVEQSPVIEVISDTFICKGSSITITATGAYTYTWSKGTTETVSDEYEITEAGIYTVTGYSQNGCKSASKEITVTEKEIPTITLAAKDSICSGDSIILLATGADTYRWIQDQYPSPETNSEIKKILFQNTTFSVIGTDNGTGCLSQPVSKTVQVDQPFTISLDGALSMCDGKSSKITASGASSYSWSDADNIIISAVDTVLLNKEGKYYIEAHKEQSKCVARDSFDVNVETNPTISVVTDTFLCKGLSINIQATGAFSYKWRNGENETISNSFSTNTSGTFSVKGYSQSGCESQEMSFNVEEKALPTITISGDSILCKDSTAQIGIEVIGNSPFSYTMDGATNSDGIFIISEAKTYYVTVTDSFGCQSSAEKEMTFTYPSISIEGKDEFCSDSSIILSAAGNAINYYWDNTSEDTTRYQITEGGEHTLIGIDEFGCGSKVSKEITKRDYPILSITDSTSFCENDSVLLSATLNRTALFYKWDDGPLLSKNEIFASKERSYTVIGFDDLLCPSLPKTTKVTEVIRPTVQISGPSYICEGNDNIELQANSTTANSYRWSTGESESSISIDKGGEYHVTGFLYGCASEPDTFEVEQKYRPAVAIQEKGEAEFCDMESITLHAISPTAISYRWNPSQETTDTLLVTQEGSYSIFVEDMYGCTNSDNIETKAVKGPDISILGESTICQYNSAILQIQCPECDSIIWNTGSNETMIETFDSGTYSAIGYNRAGCPSKVAEHQLIVRDAPKVSIEGISDITSNDSTTLTAEASGENPFVYNWHPTKETTQSIVVHGSDFNELSKFYKATVFDKYGCFNYAIVKVVRHSINLNGNLEFCEGDSSSLTATGDDILSYKWSTGETTNSITIKEGGPYSLITSHDNGMIDTFNFDVTVHPLPAIKIEGKTQFCKGDSSFLYAKGTESHIWSTGSIDSFIVVRDSGLYKSTAITEFGCKASDSVSITVFNLPNVTIEGPDSIIEGSSIFLEAEGALTYHWEKPDTSIQRIEVFDEMRYRVTGVDNNGCVNSGTKDVRIIPIPHLLINDTTDGKAIVCDGEQFKLIASGAETYLWDTGETNDTILVNESRVYSVTGCLSNGQCRTNTFSVELSPRPRMMKIDGRTKFCKDSSSVLTAHAFDEDLVNHFEWNTGENSPSINVTDSGYYSVHAVSVHGCLSDTIGTDISHYDNPILSLSGETEICSGSTTKISAFGGATYEWIGSGSESNETTVSEPGNYTIRIWNENGCHTDSVVHIQDLGTPEIHILGRDYFCEGDSSTIKVSGDRFSANYYLWNNGQTQSSITVNTPGVYSVSLSNHAGCIATDTIKIIERPNPVIAIDGANWVCFEDSTQLTCAILSGNEIARYEWSNGKTSQKIYVSSPETFEVRAIDIYGCISNTDEKTLFNRIPNPINIVGDFDICAEREDTAIISAICQDAIYYKWIEESTNDTIFESSSNSFPASKAGKYRAIAIDHYSCFSKISAEIRGHQNPKVKIRGAEIPVCDVEIATLTADVDETVKYRWGNGETTQTILCPESGDFTLWGIDEFNCYNADTAHLILNDIPDMATSENYKFCPGEQTDITVSGAKSYLWSNGSTSDNASFNAETEGFVVGTDKYGCEKKINFTISPFHIPEAFLTASPTHIERTNPRVNFNIHSSESLDSCLFEWNLGDGNTETVRGFSYNYDITNQRTFHVGLLITTLDNCHTNRQVTISCDLKIPNTITPNGDGINDIFMKGCNVDIYDRHGALLHRGDDGWDGKLPDGSITADTYYYVLTDITGEVYYGYITVKK